MLRNGSGGAGRAGEAGAVGAADDDAVGASAELFSAGDTSANHATSDHGPNGGRATSDPSGPLSLCRLSGGALAGLSREGLLSVLGDIERVANRLAGYRAEVLGALDALSRSGAAPDASPHLSLRDATGVSERDARRMVRAAGKAREHPGVLEALSVGDVNAAQAEALCDARVPDGVRAELTAAAANEDTDATRRRVRQAEADHSVETPMERFERQRQARGAGWQRDHEGMLRLWAKLDPEVGAAVEANLETLRRQYWLDDKQIRNGRRTPAQRDADVLAYVLAGITLTDTDAAAVDRLHARAHPDRHLPDDPVTGNPQRRPAPSRRTTPPKGAAKRTAAERNRHAGTAFDAADSTQDGNCFGELGLDLSNPSPLRPPQHHSDPAGHNALRPDEAGGRGVANRWDPARRLPPAQISVLIELDALRGRTDEMGLTDAGVELPPHIVRRLACDAEVIPMILGSPGGPADVGRSARTVSLRLRRLLIARDRHCQWPGCAEPPSRCDAHHVHHWIDGGPTDLDNLVLLCHRHHHHLHQHSHKMVPQPDGTWTTTHTCEPEPTTRPQRTTLQPRGP